MATYKFDPATGTYILVGDAALLSDPAIANYSLVTDRPDYSPGSTALFTANVGVGDTVTFNVVDVAGTPVSGTNAPWAVTDGGAGDLDGLVNGVIQTNWLVGQDAAGEAFVLSATDQAAGLMMTTAFTDATPVPAVPGTANGTIFTAGAEGTGTGVINSFLRVQANGTEQGYNTDGTLEFDSKAGNFTHSLTLADIPLVTIGGVQYREFRLDINENTGAPISLDALKIFSSNVDNLTGFNNTTNTFSSGSSTLLYNLDGAGDVTIKLTDWNTGSGHGDYIIDIPESNFPASGNPFLYLYSAFGTPDASDGGFEEFYVITQNNPAITITKTAQISPDSGTIGSIDNANENIVYTITLTNNGNVALTGVALTDAIEGYSAAALGVPGAPLGGATITEGGAGTHGNATLDVGETWTYTLNYDVTAADVTREQGASDDLNIHNTATVTTTQGVGGSASADVPVTPANPAFTIAKDVASVSGGAGPSNLSADNAGDTINYSIVLTNTGNVSLTGVTLSDPFATTVSASHTDSGSGTHGDNVLDVGEIWTYTATHVVSQADIDGGGPLVNLATADTDQTGPQSDDASTPVIQSPAFTIAKDVTSVTGGAGPGNLSADGAGDIVNYSIVLTNTGNESLTGVTLSDPFATTVSATHTDSGAGTHGDNVLDVGEVWTYTATHVVTQADINGGGPLVNLATADTDQTGPQSDDASTPVIQNPAFTIAKDVTSVTGGAGPGNLSADGAGDIVNYSIVLTNTGNESLTGVTLSDPFATTVSATHTDSGAGTHGDNVLDVGEVWTYTATHVVTQADINGGGPLVNLATADTDQTGPQSDDASTPVIQNPAFTIAKDVTSVTGGAGPGNLSADGAGDIVNYSIVLTNTGNESLTGVTLSDPFATTVSATHTDSGAGTHGDNVLDVGEVWTYTATHVVTQADINGGGPLVNLATADTDQTGPQSDDASTPVIQNPAFTIAKDVTSVTGGAGPGNLSADGAGDIVNYSIVLTNTGNESLTGVTLSDPFATTVSATHTDSGAGTHGDNVLDVGEVWTYTATHVVTQADINGGGPLVNLATADTDQTGPQSDDASTPVIQNPAFTIAKDVTSVTGGAGPGNLSADGAGDIVNYSIVLTNTGNESLTGVTLSDPFATTVSATHTDSGAGTHGDNVLDVGEVWTYTATHVVTQADINGGGPLVNLATADTDQTGPQSDDASTPVIQNPAFTIAKDVTSVTGGAGPGNLSADGAGDIVNYSIVLTNTGNESLTGVTLSDPFATTVSATHTDSGAGTHGDNVLDVGEVWTYTATHVVTQADINGGGPLVNLATADTDQTGPQSDDASTPVIQNPDVSIDKTATIQDGHADQVGDIINYTVEVTNTGNITLTDVHVTDSFEGAPDVTLSNSNTFDPSTHTGNTFLDPNHNGTLDPGETWTYTYQHVVTSTDLSTHGIDGDNSLDNTATVTTTAPDLGPLSDSASIPILLGPGVRTPGFWSQTGNQNNSWLKFWDGIVGNEGKQSGTNGFPNGEITLAVNSPSSNTGHLVDTNGDGVFTSADNAPSGKVSAGLLIGDFNLDGVQDNGESTFFINFNDALTLLSANQKQQQNAEYQEGRALVASWLNYLAGNPIEASDPTKVDAKDAIQWGVDWLLKTTAQTDGNITLNDLNTHAVAAGSTQWNVGIDGPDAGTSATHYASIPQYNPALDIPGGVQILGVLDEYNNHGTIYGTVIATTP
ncbi:beta strand repeat-containing protein [Bradyrhizobium sp. USDA 4454]